MNSRNASQRNSLNVLRQYQHILQDRKYQHFVHIPARIVSCLEHFGIKCDERQVTERLLSYYLFIAVVDEALDGDNLELGKSILDMFDQPGRSIALRTDVAVITKILQRQTTRKNRDLISRRLHELYREVLNERLTRSISSYIDCRKAVGRRTAELSYLLIEDLLEGESAAALILMERVGQVGCLVDSVIDLNIDVGLGLLGFTPCLSDRFRLIGRCFWEGALILSRYPALAKLFVAAIADNVRDRTRMRLAGRSNLTLEPNEDFRSVAS